MRAPVGRPDREQAALALDHDCPGIERGRRDERDAARATCLDGGADIFGAGAGLAETAPGEQQPDAPIALRRLLRVARLPFVFFLDNPYLRGLSQPRDRPLPPLDHLLLQALREET